MRAARRGGAAHALWRDYRAHNADRGEGTVRAAMRAPSRLIGDSSMHALALVRVIGAAPRPLAGLAQRALLWAHGIYVDPSADIGPGLRLPHPIAIAIGPGVKIAHDVSLYQNVTVTSRGPSGAGAPQIGPRARIYTGAVVCGGVDVGADAMVGAGVVVTADVVAGSRVVRRHGAADGGDVALATLRGAADGGDADSTTPPRDATGDLAAGLRELLVSDHRARFGSRCQPGVRRLLGSALSDRASRVTTLVRLMQAGPQPLWRLWRRLLLLHGCDVGFGATIGPGLSVPCPIGVCIGWRAVIGSGVHLLEHTCATPTRTSWHQTSATPRFELGDHASMLPGAAAFGEVRVGGGVAVAPRALVTRDVDGSSPCCDRAGEARAAHGVIGTTSDTATAQATTGRGGLLALIGSDLDRCAQAGGVTRRGAALGLPFQAAALTRLATCRRARLARVGRCVLRTLHHCYVDQGVRIGPGLLLPLPCGIRLEHGAGVGAGATIYDRVSLRSDRWQGSTDAPAIGDGVIVGTGAVVIGGFEVLADLEDGGVLVGRNQRSGAPRDGVAIRH